MKCSRKNLWDALPGPAKSMAGAVLSRFPLEYVLGNRFRATRTFLKGAQWWSADQYQVYQLGELRRMLQLVNSKCSYYRRLFREVGFDPVDFQQLSDLQHLPTIDKVCVRENLREMMTCSPERPGVDYVSTGGSTGTPFAFYAPASRSSIEYAYLTTGWERAGYALGDQMVVIRGRRVTGRNTGLLYERDQLLRQHFYSSFHMTEARTKDYLAHIALLGPCVLHAYPSSAATLAKVAIDNPNLVKGAIKAVLLESENLFEDQADVIKTAFGVTPYSSYGHSEKLVLATMCEESVDYHVWPTYGYCELLNDQGRVITTPGERGEIVGTGYINSVVPMIRYRTGDFATYGGESCPACGRNHMLLRDIDGRGRQGCLLGMDGSEISMTASLDAIHDDSLRLVLEYQFLQDHPGEAQFLVRVRDGWSEAERQRVEKRVNNRLQGQVVIEVVVVNEVYRTPQGKLLRVISSKQVEGYREGFYQ